MLTGWGIDDIKIVKKAWIFPGQKVNFFLKKKKIPPPHVEKQQVYLAKRRRGGAKIKKNRDLFLVWHHLDQSVRFRDYSAGHDY